MIGRVYLLYVDLIEVHRTLGKSFRGVSSQAAAAAYMY